jgi:hypothetical protein
VHPWNYVADPRDQHQSSAIDGSGLGIVVKGGGARIEDCYLDTVPLVLNISGGGKFLVSSASGDRHVCASYHNIIS